MYRVSTSNTKFDLIFADPPYYDFDFQKLAQVAKILAKDGVFVVESGRRTNIDCLGDFFEITKEKVYGDTKVVFCKLKI